MVAGDTTVDLKETIPRKRMRSKNSWFFSVMYRDLLLGTRLICAKRSFKLLAYIIYSTVSICVDNIYIVQLRCRLGASTDLTFHWDVGDHVTMFLNPTGFLKIINIVSYIYMTLLAMV
jgi:hypothetical protein